MRAWILLLLAACGTEPPDPPGGKSSIFPVAKGNRWEFRIQNSSGDVSTKTQTITSTSGDGFVFHTVRGDRETISIQHVRDGKLVRTSEEGKRLGVTIERITFDPYSLRVHLEMIGLGDRYTETFTERHDDGAPDVTKTQEFVVEAVDEPVTVPAGTFRALKIRRTTAGGPEKTFWYAKGVGKVKEAGGQLEELVSSELVE